MSNFHTGEVKSEESEEEDEIPTFVDQDDDEEDQQTEVRAPAVVSYEISDEEELDIIVS